MIVGKLLPLAVLAVLAPILAVPVVAVGAPKDGVKTERKQRDHDLARQAVMRREVVPLPRILTLANGYQPGEIIEIELKSKDGMLAYDVHVLTGEGAVRELYIDARSGKLLFNRPKAD